VLASLALTAGAADPPAADPWTPAATNWNKLPAVPVPPVPAPPATLPPTANPLPQGRPPEPSPVSPSRVVVFQKPAGTETPAPGGQPRPKSDGTGLPDPQPPKLGQPGGALPGAGQPGVPPVPVDFGVPFTRENVFRFESDALLQERIIQELIKEQPPTKERPGYFNPPIQLPLVPPGTPYQPTTAGYQPMRAQLEPGYVVHRRLYFEEKNSERFGWELGIAQPVVSTLAFYKDTLLWPSKLASNLFERYDTSAGKCPPGSPVPYYLYPPEIDLFGGSVGAGVIVGTVFLFP
jgi:hypothetical protein